MKTFRAVVVIASAALLNAPAASADPGWGPYQCDGGGYCGNGGGGEDYDHPGLWYPGRLLFGPPGCVSGPLGFVEVCK